MNTDVLIVGSGCSGLYCALKLPRDVRITLITKSDLESNDSYLAQGGMCMLKEQSDFDSFFEDTLKAGHYENDKESDEIMINSSPEVVEDLVSYGADFARNDDGSLAYTREGAHSHNRIIFHEDVTGKEITSTLLAQVKKLSNVTLMEYTTMVDIIERDNKCYGAIIRKQDGTLEKVTAAYTVMACGGVGGLYRFSTNFRHLTGDSLAIAKKHDVLYGKFFAKKAGFISKKWLPVFANYRRDGYDFDALFEDEKAPIKHKNIMDHFMENDAEIYSYELKKLAGFGKDGEKGFDGAITSLMMQTYLCNCDFRKRINQKGVEYGWDVAVYSSPEHIYGYDHVTSCYKEDPRTSWGKIVDHMKQLYPEAADTQIRKILK